MITFKGAPFRYSGGSFHYLNGVSCGKIEIKDTEIIENIQQIDEVDTEKAVEETFTIERVFCYKEAFLMSFSFTILPIWLFIIPLFEKQFIDPYYHLKIAKTVYDINWGFIGLFIIWGVFFAGNILWTSLQFSKLIREIKNEIMDKYISENK